jgi:hypothetical protein
MRSPSLPTTPPPLGQRVALTDRQAEQIGQVLTRLTELLEDLPVAISQQGEIISFAGAGGQLVAERLVRVAERLWRDGATYSAREVIRFEEEHIEEVERANFVVYSAHVASALIITVGWQMTVSLTQVRAEVSDAKAQVLKVLK